MQMSTESLPSHVVRVLVDNHQRFRDFLRTRVGNPTEAEEVLQAAMLKGIEKAADVRDSESAVAWFYQLLRNALADHFRRRGAEQRALARHAPELEATQAPDSELEAVVCACLGNLLETLKPEYATMLRRIDLGGAGLGEVAQELDITTNNATVRLHRARRALRERFEQSCGTCTTHGCLDCTCDPAVRTRGPTRQHGR